MMPTPGRSGRHNEEVNLRFVGRERELDAWAVVCRAGLGTWRCCLRPRRAWHREVRHRSGVWPARPRGCAGAAGMRWPTPECQRSGPGFGPRAARRPRPWGCPELVSLSRSEFESVAAVRFGAVTHAVDALLTSSAEAAGLVIILEDLQWADEASLQLVRHVSAGVSGAPLLVLATSRDPLPDLVTGLDGSSIVRPGPMTQREVGLCMGAGVHPSWSRAVQTVAGGIRCTWPSSSGRWTGRGCRLPMEWVVGASCRFGAPDCAPVESTLTRCRRLLDGASVAGELFDADLLPSSDRCGRGDRGRCVGRGSGFEAPAGVVACGGA